MLTEAEAKTKWCPFARVAHQMASGAVVASGNRVKDAKSWGAASGSLCIASSCMAWRSVPVHDIRERHLVSKATGKRVNAGFSPDVEWRLDDPSEPEPTPTGYCGLAGRP